MFSTTRSTRTSRRTTRHAVAAVLAAATVTLLAACSTTAPAPTEPESSSTAAESIQLVDGWVKAVDGGMTGAFGLIENAGDTDVTLVGATTSVASMVELHETVMGDSGTMVMQQKDGGFTIAANGSHELAPGADHIMLMGVTEALQPGDEVTIVLQFSDGSTLEHAFTVKEFTGANEDYVGDGDMGGDMGHSEDQ